MLIGISDNKRILGLQNDSNTLKPKDKDEFVHYLTKTITHNLGNNEIQNISINLVNYSDKEICRIDVIPNKNPVFISRNVKYEFFIRTANITIPLSFKET